MLPYTTICLSLPLTSGDLTATQDKDPLSRTFEVSGDVVDGPWPYGWPPFGYCSMSVLFSTFILVLIALY